MNNNVMVDAVVFIKNDCPIKVKFDGADFVQITCGHSMNDRVELSIGHDAMREIVKAYSDTLVKGQDAVPVGGDSTSQPTPGS